MTLAYIGLGSNLGDREANLNKALDMLSQKVLIAEVSPFYLSEPEIFKDQPDFLNGVALIDTDRTAPELLKILNIIEKRIGRERTFSGAPRPIDLDLLFFGSDIINQPGLEVPHPRAHIRPFVLVPMADVAPDLMHPVLHKTIGELLADLKPGFRIVKFESNQGGGKD
jgi:2-amino-4-hydroxy-6-hydroxymethyldihydropteridine diphosphokinase